MKPQGYETIVGILDRAENLFNGQKYDRTGMWMDLEYTNKEIPLDFEKLLAFNNFNFAHDIYGIYANFNRVTTKMDNLFVPRCAK